MQFVLFDDMSQCQEEDVKRLLSVCSSQRCEQALRYKHTFGQWTCLKTYELLLSLLPDDKALLPWEWNAYGKPFIPSAPAFSISHCKEAVLVAVSELPIGVDIEGIRKLNPPLIEKVMNPNEQRQIVESPYPEREFSKLWTQKEAVLKWRGTGIISDLQDVLNALPHSLTLLTRESEDHRYFYCIAYER